MSTYANNPTAAYSQIEPHPDRHSRTSPVHVSAENRQAEISTKDEGHRSSVESDDEAWLVHSPAEPGNEDMPSDLHPSVDHHDSRTQQHKPLLAGDKSNGRPTPYRRQSSFHERDSQELANLATRKRYTYAAAFLLLSLVAFAVQTETAVYIQKNLGWRKPYCMLYFTHGSWSILWPTQLLILRLQKWKQPWPAFWRRHVSLVRQTAQMVEHRTLRVPPQFSKKSPVPYFLRTTAFVTCALTVAGGSWYVAVDMTTASDLTAIYNCSAFFAYAFAVPMLGEKLRFSKVFAVAVAIVGVLVVAYGDSSSNVKHGSKSGGGAGGNDPMEDHRNTEARSRFLGNLIIGVGSVLYGFYEVLYKRVACPPDGCSAGRSMIFANTFGSCIGSFTLLVLWIPLPILHILGWEIFELPRGEAAWMMVISVIANVAFSGSFLVLISLTSPVLSSVAALLTIFLVALCDELLPEPLHNDLSTAAIIGGVLIIGAFALLSYATFVEMREERNKHSDDIAESESEIDDA